MMSANNQMHVSHCCVHVYMWVSLYMHFMVCVHAYLCVGGGGGWGVSREERDESFLLKV